MTRRKRTLRRSQSLSPFGPGAIYDILGESFAAADTTQWPQGRCETITMDRLAGDLGVRDFRAPPPAPDDLRRADGPGIPFQRFPRWLFCQRCRRMQRWNSQRESALEGDRPGCPDCRGTPPLVPVRFVAICDNGHLDDVDWPRWAHSHTTGPGACRSLDLEFRTDSGHGGGLESVRVRCRACEQGRDLAQIVIKDAMRRVGASCRGLQPWLHPDRAEECDRVPQVVQRGASNVHFPDLRSALDIPPWSNYDPDSEQATALRTDQMFAALVAQRDNSNPTLIESLTEALAAQHGVPAETVQRLAASEGQQRARAVAPAGGDLIEQEWTAFAEPTGEADPRDRFVTRRVAFNPDGEPTYRGLERLVDRVIIADKLREVRALAGFSRLEPASRSIRPDLGRNLDWLPGLEIYGEGVFLRLDEEHLREWEQRPDVRARTSPLEDNRSQSRLTSVLSDPASPRFVLLHTLAHLLIRQLSYECGYSSASLRERLYSRTSDDRPMSGVLIYTASGDSEGTLGGLARQGEPPRLANTLSTALSRSAWCSTDPICIESAGQGLQAMNRAACHACALVAETSCTQLNSLLDRGLVVGTPESPDTGFFADILTEAVAPSVGEPES